MGYETYGGERSSMRAAPFVRLSAERLIYLSTQFLLKHNLRAGTTCLLAFDPATRCVRIAFGVKKQSGAVLLSPTAEKKAVNIAASGFTKWFGIQPGGARYYADRYTVTDNVLTFGPVELES